MMCQDERRVARRREALAARFFDTCIETAAPSLSALDAPRGLACLRSLADRERLVVLLTWVRRLPVVNVEIRLTAQEEVEERTVSSYTLVHGGALQR